MLSCDFRYRTLVPNEASTRSTRVTSLMTKSEFDEMHDLYIDAAQLSSDGNIDADVQVSSSINVRCEEQVSLLFIILRTFPITLMLHLFQ